MIDRQADWLLREVKVAKQRREEEVNRRKQDVELNRLTLINFQQYSEQVKDKGTVLCRPGLQKLYLFIYLSIFIYFTHVYLFICLSIYLFIASVCTSVCLFVLQFIRLYIQPSHLFIR